MSRIPRRRRRSLLRCRVPQMECLESRAMLAANLVPYNQTFLLQSLPSATKTIYLDFTGHTTPTAIASSFGSTTPIYSPPFSVDADPAFSTVELDTIQRVWARVAEDFAPFQVNVTTREPSLDDLRKVGTADTRWGIRVVIGDQDSGNHPAAGVGGIAILGSFNDADDVPCFVNTASSTNENYIAINSSHEAGHSLGLDHHGISGVLPPPGDYYGGHGGTGPTGWGPIMGAPFSRNLTQWSKGEYAMATTLQDDLAVIVGGNGFGYRPDDVGGTFTASRRLTRPAGQTTLQGRGIIERNTDADVFSFTVTTGVVDLRVRPLSVLDATTFSGANLDVGATLYSSDGRVVADVQPQNRLDAQFTGVLTGGTYYVRVFGTGNGDPLVDGYSNYASLGQYTVDVSQSTPVDPLITITGPSSVAEGTSGLKVVSFPVTLSRASSSAVSVSYTTRDGTATLFDGDYLAAAGVLTFAAGETSKTISVTVVGDTRFEPNETFSVELSAPTNALLGRGEASATIVNDDRATPAPAVFVDAIGPPAPVAEGSSATFTIQLSAPLATALSVTYRTVSGTATAGQDFTAISSGTVIFAPGDTVQTVTVATINDPRPETDERFTLQLVRRPGQVTYRTTSATATIEFNDGGQPARISSASWLALAAYADAVAPSTRRK